MAFSYYLITSTTPSGFYRVFFVAQFTLLGQYTRSLTRSQIISFMVHTITYSKSGNFIYSSHEQLLYVRLLHLWFTRSLKVGIFHSFTNDQLLQVRLFNLWFTRVLTVSEVILFMVHMSTQYKSDNTRFTRPLTMIQVISFMVDATYYESGYCIYGSHGHLLRVRLLHLRYRGPSSISQVVSFVTHTITYQKSGYYIYGSHNHLRRVR